MSQSRHFAGETESRQQALDHLLAEVMEARVRNLEARHRLQSTIKSIKQRCDAGTRRHHGAGGTDHGTGTVAKLAGGAVWG